MSNSEKTALTAQTSQGRRVFSVATFLLVFAGLVGIYPLTVAIQARAWEVLRVGATLWLASLILYIVSMVLSRRGYERVAAWLVLGGFIINICSRVFAISGIGLIVGLMVVVLTVILARVMQFSQKDFWRACGIAASLMIMTVAYDLLETSRPAIPEHLRTYVPFAAGILIIALLIPIFRDFPNYPLRTKATTALVSAVVLSVTVIAILTNYSFRAALLDEIGNSLVEFAGTKASEIALALDRESDILKAMAFDQAIQDAAQAANTTDSLSPDEIERLDQQWQTAYAANDEADSLVSGVLHGDEANHLRHFQEEFPQFVEIILTDQQGVNIAATDMTSDYYHADEEWWQVAYQNGLSISQPEYDESSQSTAIIMAVAVYIDGSEDVVGILRTTVNVEFLEELLVTGLFGETGQTDIYLPNGQELEIERETDGTFELELEEEAIDANLLSQPVGTYAEILHNETPALASQAIVGVLGDTEEDEMAIANLDWRIVVTQERSEALQPVEAQSQNVLILAFVISLVVATAAAALARLISAPILRLHTVAEQVASGDLSVRANVETKDEIGALAEAFNNMTMQLGSLVGSLEERVAERTRALAVSAEISRRLSTILDPEQLVKEVVEQLQQTFNYYHVHIYLFDQRRENLLLVGGTGDTGHTMLQNQHAIAIGKGLVGRAAQSNQVVLVPETTIDPNWLPNPLLPDTKAEIAVPIRIGDMVLGVLDIQHNVANGLTQEDGELLQAIANQVAIALQNANQYIQTQANEARLRAMIDAIPTAVMITRISDGVVLYANENAAALFDYSREELIGNITPNLYYHAKDRETVLGILGREGILVNYEVLGRRQDNSPVWVTLSVQKMDYAGEPSFYVNATDITTQKQSAEVTLKRAERDRVLNRIAAKIRSTVSMEQVLQLAAQEARQAVGASRSVIVIDPKQVTDSKPVMVEPDV